MASRYIDPPRPPRPPTFVPLGPANGDMRSLFQAEFQQLWTAENHQKIPPGTGGSLAPAPPVNLQGNPFAPSFYTQQKNSALHGVADYDYAVGLGYDLIPASVFARGFHNSDLANEPAMGALPRQSNYPRDPQNLFALHRDMRGGGDDGLHVISYQVQAMDLAPLLNNERLWQVGNIGDCLRGLSVNRDLGVDMPYGHRVTEVGVHQRDRGNPVGMLRDPPILEPPREGTASHYERAKFSEAQMQNGGSSCTIV